VKIEVDEIMTELPQTALEALKDIAALAQSADKYTLRHFADKIIAKCARALAAPPQRCSDETAHNVRDATIKEIARYLDEEGHGIPAEKVRFMGPAVTRPQPSDDCASDRNITFEEVLKFLDGQAKLIRSLAVSRPHQPGEA